MLEIVMLVEQTYKSALITRNLRILEQLSGKAYLNAKAKGRNHLLELNISD